MSGSPRCRRWHDMRRWVTTLALTVALVAATATTAGSGTAKPEYVRPSSLIVVFATDTTAELVWNASPYANYYKLQVSTRSDFDDDHRRTIREPDSVNVNAFTVTGLDPGRKHWARVAVCNWEGQRLSAWSKVVVVRTAP